jgi:hypothetical protein
MADTNRKHKGSRAENLVVEDGLLCSDEVLMGMGFGWVESMFGITNDWSVCGGGSSGGGSSGGGGCVGCAGCAGGGMCLYARTALATHKKKVVRNAC